MKKPVLIAEYQDINGFILKKRPIENGSITVPFVVPMVSIPIMKRLKSIDFDNNELTPNDPLEKKDFELEEITIIYKYKEI